MANRSSYPEESAGYHSVSNVEEESMALSYLKEQGIQNTDAALILGSGYQWFTDCLTNSIRIPYQEIPGMPQTTILGHSGTLFQGQLGKKMLLVFSGRFHHYEGYSFEQTTLPVRLAKGLGAKELWITNAAGGIHPDFRVGTLMLIESILRLQQRVGEPHPSPFSFPETSLQQRISQLLEKASQKGIPLTKGTYIYVKGPSYETPAEIRAFRKMGADAVGMSTVPELTEAARLNLPATAISLITNAAAGLNDEKLAHEDIADVSRRSKESIETLFNLIFE
jgi:purine-nucleoside phosphorylase